MEIAANILGVMGVLIALTIIYVIHKLDSLTSKGLKYEKSIIVSTRTVYPDIQLNSNQQEAYLILQRGEDIQKFNDYTVRTLSSIEKDQVLDNVSLSDLGGPITV